MQTPAGKMKRWYNHLRRYNHYDLVLQSDYQPILPLTAAAEKILYVNYEGVSLRDRPGLKNILSFTQQQVGIS